jgi:hypothetical protein
MSLLGGMPGTNGTEIQSTSQLEVTYLNGHDSLDFIPEGTVDINDAKLTEREMTPIYKPELNEHIIAGSSGKKELKSNGVLRLK